MAVAGGSTSLTDLTLIVNERLGNYAKPASEDAVGDGISTVFELTHSNIVAGSEVVEVAGVAADNTLLSDIGVVVFDSFPAEQAAVHVSYMYIQWTEKQVRDAINEALVEAWAEFHRDMTDETVVVADGTTSEFELPDDCSYLFRVEYRADPADAYSVVRQWRVNDTDYVNSVTIYNPESSGTYRINYVSSVVELALGADTMEEAGVPTHAKWGVVWCACATLLGGLLGQRSRGNQFFNVEGSNVAKIYEIQKVMADYRSMAEIAFKKARRSPRISTS